MKKFFLAAMLFCGCLPAFSQQTENYPDPVADYPLAFTVADSYTLVEPEISTLVDLSDKTVRRQIYKDGIVYILALGSGDEPYVYAIKDGTVTELDKEVIAMPSNGILKLSDIALTADGYLVGCGYSTNTYNDNLNKSTTVVVNIYKWEKNVETGLPGTCSKWFSSPFSANFTNGCIGKSITYSGTLADGNLIATCGSAAAQTMRFVNFAIANSALSTTTRANCSDSFKRDVTAVNDDYELNVSPNDKAYYVYDGGLISPMEWHFNADAAAETILGTNSQVPVAGNGANYFRFAGRSLMVSPNVEDGKVTGLLLFDVTDGFDAAKKIDVNCSITGTDYGYASAHGSFDVTVDNNQSVQTQLVLSLIVDGEMYQWSQDPQIVEFENNSTPNAFAYGITNTITGMTFYVDYTLNTDAKNVEVVFINSATEEEDLVFELGSQAKGEHSESFNVSELTNNVYYKWGIRVTGEHKSKVTEFGSYRFFRPRGVDVDKSFESPYFGNVYCTEGYSISSTTYFSGTSGEGSGSGFYAFDASFSPIKNPKTDKYGFTGGLTFSNTSIADLSRVRVSHDGRIFVTRANTVGDYICYAKDFSDLYANDKYTSLTTGLTFDASTKNYSDADGNYVVGPNVSLDIEGSGSDLKLYVLSKPTFDTNTTKDASLDVIDLGMGSILTAGTNISALSAKYTIMQYANIVHDNRGGIWYCQYRATPKDTEPALVYVDADGVERYKDLVVRGGGGIRFSPDFKYLAIASSATTFSIYTVYFADDGTPSLKEVSTITHGIGTNVNDIAWDLAGNIYICGNSSEYLKGFALPRATPFTTMAPSKYYFTKSSTSVEDVEAETAEPEYYNLQGIRVAADNLTPGIYIRRIGSKTDKILVK